MRRSSFHSAHALLLTAGLLATCAPLAAAWGPPRSGGLGHQTLRGGSGPDFLRGNEGPDRVHGGGGADLLTGDGGPDAVFGGSGNDTLIGGGGRDVLTGGSGNDVASGGFGMDGLNGGPGDDALDGGNDKDTLVGGDGNDVLHGGSGTDKLNGGAGDDLLFADTGSDFIAGGDGDDTIYVEGSAYTRVVCGPGDDTVYVGVVAEATQDYLGQGDAGRRGADCENVRLTDVLYDPNKGATYLAPDGGGDRAGTVRDDILLGGPGADTLRAGRGNDVLWGLRQPDVQSIQRDVLDAGPGDDTVYGGPGPQIISGGPGDDLLQSGIGQGTIAGGPGADTIRLRGVGLTTVSGGPGNDTVYARGSVRGQIRCGSGRDVAHVDSGDRAARDCERLVGAPAARGPTPAPRRAATNHADVVRSTPGLTQWWRLGERPLPGALYNAQVSDQVANATGFMGSGNLAAAGVTDDGDTAWESARAYFEPGRVYGAYGGEFRFDASNAVLHGQFTFESWIRPEDRGIARTLLADIRTGSADGVVLVRETDGSLRALIASDTTTAQVVLQTPPLNLVEASWHHVVLTRADDRIAIYVDGEVAAEGPATTIAFSGPTSSFGVGTRFGRYGAWVGGLDEIAVYDRPLDAATVRAHFRAGEDGVAPVARADPPLVGLQGRSTVVSLTTDKAGSSFRCALDGGGELPCRREIPLAAIADGDHTLSVRAVDRFGAVQAQPTVLRFTVDSRVPRTILVVRVSAGHDNRAIASFGADGAARFECRTASGGTQFLPEDLLPYSPCSPPLDIAPGKELAVRAVDAAGNRDPAPAVVYVPHNLTFVYRAAVPPFAGVQAEAAVDGDGTVVGGPTGLQCRTDGRDWAACARYFRLPILQAGRHVLEVRQQLGADGTVTAPPLAWTVTPKPGAVAIAGMQLQLVVERSARLLRRAPRLRFALSAPAAVELEILRGGRKPAIRVAATGSSGANIVKIPARKLRELREGRYTVRLVARGPSGPPSVQELPLAIVPPLR